MAPSSALCCFFFTMVLSQEPSLVIRVWTTLVYADDTQIYLTMSPRGKVDAVNSLKDCLLDIKVWSANNKLRLNEKQVRTDPFFLTVPGAQCLYQFWQPTRVVLKNHLNMFQRPGHHIGQTPYSYKSYIKNVCKSGILVRSLQNWKDQATAWRKPPLKDLSTPSSPPIWRSRCNSLLDRPPNSTR